MCAEVEKLEYKIHQMRESLNFIVGETGLNSKGTIWYSQKLDELIMRYQKLTMYRFQK